MCFLDGIIFDGDQPFEEPGKHKDFISFSEKQVPINHVYRPPKGQPQLWCKWAPSNDGISLICAVLTPSPPLSHVALFNDVLNGMRYPRPGHTYIHPPRYNNSLPFP